MAEAVPVGAAPVPRINRIELERPWAWLAAGWRDLMRAPAVGLTYGVVFAAAGWAITFGLWWLDMLYFVLPMVAGFLIVGPILAVGLYEVSRRLAEGRPVGLGDALGAFRANPTQIAFLGVALLLFFFAWMRLAVLIFMLFFGLEPPSPVDFLGRVFLSADSVPFLAVGFAVGGVLAGLAFCLSAVSIPLLLDRPDEHVVTAIATSFKAVLDNPATMAFWAALIVLFVGAGLLTFYIGLIVALPLIGHASWHAYRDVVAYGDPEAAAAPAATAARRPV
ncbi:MAG TPA: DUF2189 domain-containing protein [Geminicoccaceae bacterium]|nr:DUF2189 domain-containing protein [Geminicoccaceae bacterium]